MSNNKRKHKYQYQRVEERRNYVDKKGEKERKQMERISQKKISIGTFTFFKPKSITKLGGFTLAFSKPLIEKDVFLILKEIFNENIIVETKLLESDRKIKSIFVKLEKTVEFGYLRKSVTESFEKIF